LEEEVSEIHEPTTAETVRRAQRRTLDVDQFSNNSAVFIAWLEVESAILNLARDAHLLRPNMPAPVAAQRLLDMNLIDDSIFCAIRELQEWRNISVHPTEARLVSKSESDRFKKLAEKVAAVLKDRRHALS
jgi:hypothetical protein